MGWIHERSMKTGGSMGGNKKSARNSSPIRKILYIIRYTSNIFDRNWVKLECGHETSSNGIYKAHCIYCKEELESSIKPEEDYRTVKKEGKNWELYLGDCIDIMKDLKENSIDFSIFSPPFSSLYTYSATERDIGNCKTHDQFLTHFKFVSDDLLRITKEGRIAAVHCSQVPAMLVRDGYIGMKDLRGDLIRLFQTSGWIYHGEVCIDKNPQSQAIRTHSKGLLFNQLKKDSSWLRPGLADYILLFRKDGENQIPIKPDITNNEWITYAHPIWYDIKETDTLSVAEARSNDDERHICPLQLGTIERCIKLWSNPNEVVFSPFAGIGSEGYQSIKLGRRFIGVELKESYFNCAVKNLMVSSQHQNSLL